MCYISELGQSIVRGQGASIKGGRIRWLCLVQTKPQIAMLKI
jgi:hypothetical protein